MSAGMVTTGAAARSPGAMGVEGVAGGARHSGLRDGAAATGMTARSPSGAAVASAAGREAALRRACSELEGVFFEQMLKAMRETIPEGGVVSGGTGEDIFTGLMDTHLSTTAASRLEGSLGDALYRQLRGALGGAADGAHASVDGSDVAGREAGTP